MGKIHSVRTFRQGDQNKCLLYPFWGSSVASKILRPWRSPENVPGSVRNPLLSRTKAAQHMGGAHVQTWPRLESILRFQSSRPLPYGLWEKNFRYRLINLIRTEQAVSTRTHGPHSNLSNSVHATGLYSHTEHLPRPSAVLASRQAGGLLHGRPMLLKT